MVSALASYSDNPSSNPANYLNNYLWEKIRINEKEARVEPCLRRGILCGTKFDKSFKAKGSRRSFYKLKTSELEPKNLGPFQL